MKVSLPADFLASARKKAVGMFCNSLEIAGFRKGHIPENIVTEKTGEGKILEEANVLSACFSVVPSFHNSFFAPVQ